MKPLLILGLGLTALSTQAQLVVQSGATLFIDAGATVTVQGDVTSNANIGGTGKILMKGTTLQNMNMNGFSIPNLEIDNTTNVALGGEAKVTGVLTFTNGKLQLGNNNFILASTGSHTGAATGKFAETNGTGQFRKEVTAAGNQILPVGNGTDYNPLEYQITGGSYSSAFVGARSVGSGHPAKHPRSTDFLTAYWALSNAGISGATMNAVGTYADAEITGTEADLRTMTYNGATWALGTSIDNATNKATAAVTGASGDLYAMNRFVLLNTKTFLQGPFNSGTGLMSDQLRSTDVTQTAGTASSNNLIPTSDPYRSAPLTTTFVHVNNSVSETIAPTVLNHQGSPGDNIVDWIFLELRNTATTGNTVLQTRAALVQRDGDVVDVDGVSPVYFKNVDGGNYSIGVRHRNHIGMYTNPSTYSHALSLAPSAVLNFTSIAAGNLMGAENTNYLVDAARNVLYAGNASMNTRIAYNGSGNDAAYILGTLLSGNPAGNLASVYSVGDANFNRRVTYSGSGNDASYILSTPLAGNPSGFKAEVKPN